MARISTKRDAFKAKSKAELRLVLIWMSVKSLWQCLTQYVLFLWQHNPLAIILQRQRRLYFIENYGEVLIKPRLTERILDLFLTDYRRRKRLLGWVHSRLHHVPVIDFCSSWQDGIALCALLESVCPGVCPSYHLLQQHNRVKNCRLGLKLANKYLYLPMDLLSPEEMAIAEQSTEPKIIQYVSMLKWASQNIKDKWTSLHESLIAAKTGKCFAKGSGLRNGIVGRRSKFTIIISDTIGVFNLLVEVRGPNSEYCGERIVSLHQAKGMLDKSFDITEPNPPYSDAIKYMEDGSGSTFVRKKVPPRYVAETVSEMIHLDFQCGEEGSFYVTFVPRRAGMHNVSIKWQNHHVDGSPYRVKVYKASNISTKTLKGAQEKRVIYDSLSFSVDGSQEDSIAGSDRLTDDDSQASSQVVGPSGRTAAAIAKSKAYSKGRQLTVTRRRVLRRIITRNGEDIVIEEAVSPTLSRQSSATDNSDDEFRLQKHSLLNDNHEEIVPARSPRASFETHTPAHAPTTLSTVEEEEKEKQSSASAGSSSCDGQPLDTDAVKDALIRFQSQSSLDQTKHRQYSIDVVEVSADDVLEDIPVIVSGSNSTVKERVTVQNLEALNENDAEEVLDYSESLKEITTLSHLETVNEHDNKTGDAGKTNEVANETRLERIKEEPEHVVENYPSKTPAYRTRSDGPLYQLRKEAVAIVTKAPSLGESSSDMSSGEDIHTSPDEENHSSPTLKLLHSSSLKKACMYVSQQKIIGREDEELQPLPRVKAVKKTKLRSTRSLPIMRKLHQRDQVDNCSINDLLKCLKQLERETSEDLNDNYLPNAECHPIPRMRVSEDNFKHEKYAITEPITIAKENTPSGRQRNETSPNPFGIDQGNLSQRTQPAEVSAAPPKDKSSGPLQNDSLLNDLEDKKLAKASKDKENDDALNKTKLCRFSFQLPTGMKEPQKDNDFSKSPPSPREPLKRQNPVQSKNSSQDSSNESDKKSKGKMSGSTELREESYDTDKGEPNVFRSISIQRSPCKDTLYTSVVHIVIPKPKVDKSTQVTHTEITAETGWNVMEGMYLLLRRLCIKVPTLTEEVNAIDGLQTVMQAGVQTPAPQERNDTQRAVTAKPGANADKRSENETKETKGLPVCIVDTNRRKNELDNRNMNHVDDWLERNQEIMNIQANLQPARQMTIETVDSGYDDNPSNFNRNPRWSLPLIRQANGHLRLCRKPYKGQMFLPAKLVLSTSSQSQNTSIDKRDNDEEADDEYDDTVDEYQFDANKMNLIRKRRHFSRRVESFSLSDSELETKKSSYKRNRRGWKDVLLVNRLFPRKERTKPLNTWETDKPGTLQKRKSGTFKKTLSVNNAVKQLSVESTDDDASVFVDSSDHSHLKPKHTRMNLKNPNPPSSWKDFSSGSERQLTSISSIEDSYRGFGVSKSDRHDFLSHIDEFQSLCPAATELEVPERNTVEDDDNQFEIKSVSKMSISSRSTESDGIEEDEILRSYIREKRHSWDGILDFDAGDYEIGINEEELAERSVLSDDGLYTDFSTIRKNSDTNFEDNGSELADILGDPSDVGMAIDVHSNLSEASGHSEKENHKVDENESLESVTVGQEQEVIAQNFYEDIENKVRVGGPGLSSGHVGVQNCFQVWSLDPGSGSLNVSITGPRPHTVTETSVLYTGDNLYEVTYEVTQPGFYKIFVKWADVNLPSSPYIAEITF